MAKEICAMWKQNTAQVIPLVISSTAHNTRHSQETDINPPHRRDSNPQSQKKQKASVLHFRPHGHMDSECSVGY